MSLSEVMLSADIGETKQADDEAWHVEKSTRLRSERWRKGGRRYSAEGVRDVIGLLMRYRYPSPELGVVLLVDAKGVRRVVPLLPETREAFVESRCGLGVLLSCWRAVRRLPMLSDDKCLMDWICVIDGRDARVDILGS